MSHGWNNDDAAAEELYTKLFTNFADVTADDPAYCQEENCDRGSNLAVEEIR